VLQEKLRRVAGLSALHLVRPYGGDVLAAVFVYTFVRAFAETTPRAAALLAFAFACTVEAGQYVHLAEALGFRQGSPVAIILGTGFDWWDILSYLAGPALALFADRIPAPGRRCVRRPH
jgi:hypothetical protein